MVKKIKTKHKGSNKPSQSTEGDEDGMLKNFTTKEDWDEFFTNRDAGDSFERLADWPQLERVLLECLSSLTSSEKLRADLPILVPACGSSMLSEHLYKAGFLKITNVDFSSVVITKMLNMHVIDRPEMEWRVMDMTNMMILDEEFDAIVDKGGLTTLMEPKNNQTLFPIYISQVKRILKTGGKFICVTSAETRVLELLFHSFRFGWKTSVHGIAQDQSSTKPEKKVFVVVAEKEKLPDTVSQISSFLDGDDDDDDQARNLRDVLGTENKARDAYINGAVVAYSLEDLKQGAKGPLSKYECGRLIKLILADPKISRASYSAVLLDYKQDSGFFISHFGVYIVPQLRFSSWLSTSEEGQWNVVSNNRAARLLMVFLDFTHSGVSLEDVNEDVLRLAKYLVPGFVDEHQPLQLSTYFASDKVMRNTLHKGACGCAGEFLVEEVIYEAVKNTKFRYLSIMRNGLLLTYETFLSRKKSTEAEKPTEREASTSSGELEVNHNFLSCECHTGFIAGTLLAAQYMILRGPYEGVSKVVFIGLGAGLLPMFVTLNHEGLIIEVVESDPEILQVAKSFFSFKEDGLLKVHKVDGELFVKKLANSEDEDAKIDILIIDATSSVPGVLRLPHPTYIEASFIESAYKSLADKGMFVMVMITDSTALREEVYSRLDKVFGIIFYLKHEKFSEIIIAVKTDVPYDDTIHSEAVYELAMVLKEVKEPWSELVQDMSTKVEVYKGGEGKTTT